MNRNRNRNRIRIASMVAAALAVAAPAMAGDAGISIGDKAPMAQTKMRTVDGSTTTIAAAAGKQGTLVIFTCNSCPWVKAWQGRMVELANAYVKKGVGVIMINANDPEVNGEDGFDGMVARAKQLGMGFPYAVDASSDIARAFGATRTPEAYLFDADGQLVYHGTIDDNARHPDAVKEHFLADALEAMLGGEPVPSPETKALGCSIKFRGGTQKTSS